MMTRKSKIPAVLIACDASWIAGTSPAMTGGEAADAAMPHGFRQ
jgi:hypothetical protein